MSNNTERDTHFQNFADQVVDELLQTEDLWIDTINDDWRKEWETIIARRAYDLSMHVLEKMDPIGLQSMTNEDIIRGVPDMLELPEVKE
jgi:hypothetical protein